jgi:hypothetical protein
MYKILRLTQTHPIAFFKTTMLGLAEQCVFNQIQFTHTHLIAFLETTMLNMVEQCFLKLNQFTLAHLIAISQTIEQICGVLQYMYNILRLTQTHPIAFLKTTMLKMVGQCLLDIPHFTPTHLIAIS